MRIMKPTALNKKVKWGDRLLDLWILNNNKTTKQSQVPVLPCTEMLFPRWTATDMHCSKKSADLGSYVIE